MQHDESQLNKFIVFTIADYLLALPMSDVVKVVNVSPADSKRLPKIGLLQIGKYIIKILDLHQHSSLDALPDSSDHPSFLVVTHDSQRELYGILVNEPPDIVELPPEAMRSLPKSSHHSNPMTEMVSHVAVLSQQEVIKTIFLLDLKRITETV
ncbi:MAG: chemotaxis protein CheW [Scytonema sp. RU_4_4]|nr:chemotaxis protein CheW [Scytonema sp. RU_4_4]NJR74250.1 chemotaxis protein CheW [Scytonema sp. CRU_2_7]